MGVELFSENNSSMGVSPRISFSYDLCQSDVAAVEQQSHPLRSNSSSSRRNSSMEFDFCVRESFEQESSSADELFSDGKMIPTELKKKPAQPKQLDQVMPQYVPLPIVPAAADLRDHRNISTTKDSGKESKIMSNEAEEKQGSKSFWSFKRSSSCGSGYGRSLCPLPLLSRSNSTGSSSSSVKRSLFSKEGHNQKQNSQKSASKKLYSSSSSQPSSGSMSYQKPPLKKGQYGSYGNAAPFNPVLNVPTANLFGFGLMFSNGKDKTKKK